MNTRKLFSVAAFLPLAAMAVTSDNTVGVMKISSGLRDTIISVPWEACGTGGSVKVADLVKTTGLAKGAILCY